VVGTTGRLYHLHATVRDMRSGFCEASGYVDLSRTERWRLAASSCPNQHLRTALHIGASDLSHPSESVLDKSLPQPEVGSYPAHCCAGTSEQGPSKCFKTSLVQKSRSCCFTTIAVALPQPRLRLLFRPSCSCHGALKSESFFKPCQDTR
jgi:hypothetical protein